MNTIEFEGRLEDEEPKETPWAGRYPERKLYYGSETILVTVCYR